MEKDLINSLNFILEVDKMKSVFRRNINLDRRPENDAEHSFHIAVMAMTLKNYCAIDGVDFDKAVKMCLAHDLIEIYAGDTFCWDKEAIKSKADRELKSADKLFSMLPADLGNEFRSLWEEFDAVETNTSKYANSMDRLQPFMLNNNTEGFTWRLAHTTMSQAMERFSIIKEVLPKCWEYVDEGLKNGVKKGYIIDDLK